jgi:hypothetical protein
VKTARSLVDLRYRQRLQDHMDDSEDSYSAKHSTYAGNYYPAACDLHSGGSAYTSNATGSNLSHGHSASLVPSHQSLSFVRGRIGIRRNAKHMDFSHTPVYNDDLSVCQGASSTSASGYSAYGSSFRCEPATQGWSLRNFFHSRRY